MAVEVAVAGSVVAVDVSSTVEVSTGDEPASDRGEDLPEEVEVAAKMITATISMNNRLPIPMLALGLMGRNTYPYQHPMKGRTVHRMKKYSTRLRTYSTGAR